MKGEVGIDGHDEGRGLQQKRSGPHWNRHCRRDNENIDNGEGQLKAWIESAGRRQTSRLGQRPGGRMTRGRGRGVGSPG